MHTCASIFAYQQITEHHIKTQSTPGNLKKTPLKISPKTRPILKSVCKKPHHNCFSVMWKIYVNGSNGSRYYCLQMTACRKRINIIQKYLRTNSLELETRSCNSNSFFRPFNNFPKHLVSNNRYFVVKCPLQNI